METYWDDGQGKKLDTDNKIHSRAHRINLAFFANLRRASYTITSRVALVLSRNFQNPPPFGSPLHG
ncbi:hypothetical protein [Treponema sp. R8-4-B8]